MPSPFCALSTCSKKTADPTGYCYLHRHSIPSGEPGGARIPPPPVTGPREVRWMPGDGPHPTGGYASKERRNGTETYSLGGKLHRLDGPAAVWDHGHEEWWVHGKKHRADGPAEIYSDGQEGWFLEGERHRLDGPAVDYSGTKDYEPGDDEWWVHGKRLSGEDFGRLREALDGGAPLEWALAYAEGDSTDATS